MTPENKREHNLVIRRLKNADCEMPFSTGDKSFDLENPSGTLEEYFRSEKERKFNVFILIKKLKTTGLLRFRDEFDGKRMEEEGISEGVPAMYLSRIGVLRSEQKMHLGNLLREYFFHIAMCKANKRNTDSFLIYLKCRDVPEILNYYNKLGPFKLIKKYEDKIWGKAVILGINFEIYSH